MATTALDDLGCRCCPGADSRLWRHLDVRPQWRGRDGWACPVDDGSIDSHADSNTHRAADCDSNSDANADRDCNRDANSYDYADCYSIAYTRANRNGNNTAHADAQALAEHHERTIPGQRRT